MEGYGEAVFATEYLCKEYRHTVALRDVSITIPRGQIYGLIGENGAGKTIAPPGSADCVMFNFGWLPGAAHDVHSTADSTLPALQAGLDALKPGGVLAAVLYSGKVIGNAEKKAAAEFFRSLPLADYTVLICEFANWADTAPLPCFVIKREK